MPTIELYPTGAGSETNIPNLVGAATHWQACEVDAGDTNYVETPATGGAPATYRDLFDLTTGLSGGIITNVMVLARVKKNQAPPLAGCSIRTGGSTYDGDLTSTAINSYQTISWSWATNPNTGVAWTWVDINALEAGVRLQGSMSYYERCSFVYVQVTTSSFAYPTKAITRVTGLIHRYDRGNYSLEAILGSLTTDFAVPGVDSGAPKSYISKESEYASILAQINSLINQSQGTSGTEYAIIQEQILQLRLRLERLA